jgi:hypothetical protein
MAPFATEIDPISSTFDHDLALASIAVGFTGFSLLGIIIVVVVQRRRARDPRLQADGVDEREVWANVWAAATRAVGQWECDYLVVGPASERKKAGVLPPVQARPARRARHHHASSDSDPLLRDPDAVRIGEGALPDPGPEPERKEEEEQNERLSELAATLANEVKRADSDEESSEMLPELKRVERPLVALKPLSSVEQPMAPEGGDLHWSDEGDGADVKWDDEDSISV